MYAPWSQKEIKEQQKTAEAKTDEQKTAEVTTEEQKTKGTKAEKVCLAPSPSLRYISTRAHTNPPDPNPLIGHSRWAFRVTPIQLLQGTFFVASKNCCRAQLLSVADTRGKAQDTHFHTNPPTCIGCLPAPTPIMHASRPLKPLTSPHGPARNPPPPPSDVDTCGPEPNPTRAPHRASRSVFHPFATLSDV